MKKKYKGTFCWYGENHVLYTTTTNPVFARANLSIQLAKKLGRTKSVIRNYFTGTNKYNIEEVISE